MRRFVSLATLLVGSSLLAGCPIYPVDSCYSSYDCSNGYVCDNYLGQCVAPKGDDDDDDNVTPPPPRPQPPDTTPSCAVPSDCAAGETCGEKGFCLPGDCTFWGCVSGFECAENPEGKSFSCVDSRGGSGGSGGSGGASAICTSRATTNAAAPLPPATGEILLVEEVEKSSFCLAGLESDPSTSKLVTDGERSFSNDLDDALPTHVASLTIVGQVASTETINCNAPNPDAPDDAAVVECVLTMATNAISQAQYESTGAPFTINVTTWTDQAFLGSTSGLKLNKTLRFSGRPDPQQSEIDADVFIDVHSTVRNEGPGSRPPPAP